MSDETVYKNVRDFLSHFIGAELVDITQNDEPPDEDGKYVELMFGNGHTMRFFIHDELAFSYSEDESE